MKLYFGEPTSAGSIVQVMQFDPVSYKRGVMTKLPVLYSDRHVKHDAVVGWGTCRGYAAQLAYAMIHDAHKGHVDDPRYIAKKVYHRFKAQVISRLPRNVPWVMCEETVRAACERIITDSVY